MGEGGRGSRKGDGKLGKIEKGKESEKARHGCQKFGYGRRRVRECAVCYGRLL